MEDSMINMPNLFDEKVGSKRVRNGEEEIPGRLEKRPSGILGVSNGGDLVGNEGGIANGGGGGIIDTFISNVFHNNKSGARDELVEVGGEDENTREDLGGGEGGESGGGGGIISDFFSNIFHHNGNAKSDHLVNEVDEKTECLGGGPGSVEENGGGDGESVNLNVEKSPKKDEVVDIMPSKDPKGPTSKLKPDDYAERVFFLNNN